MKPLASTRRIFPLYARFSLLGSVFENGETAQKMNFWGF
jgi:hypothetical protein